MMYNTIKIFLFLVFIGTQALGQTHYTCGTGNMDSAAFVNKPWVGNNQFLLDLIDSIGYGAATPKSNIQGGFDAQTLYWIPVKAWVYNDDNEDGGIDEVEVEASIDSLNHYFAGQVNTTGHASPHTLMQFYLRCDIAYINNSNYAITPSENEIDEMWDNNHETGALNVHFAQSITGLAGKGRFPGSSKSFVIVLNTGTNAHLGSAFPHEVGHAFDLAHTHQGRCWFHSDNKDCGNCHQEAVSRAKIQPVGCGNFSGDLKCEVNGDGYCDTPADPNILELVGGNTQDGFTYNGTGKDNWDELWTPDIYNIMSYSRVEAMEFFSPMQVGTMYYWVLGIVPDIIFPSAFDLHIANSFVDIYEPDNRRHDDDEHTIDFDESQHRGLHAERFGYKSNPSFGYCDQDWVRFTVPGSASYEVNVFTEPVPGNQQVDTQISLFDATGNTLLISNDNKAPSDIYSEISGFELAAGDYWILVESMGNTSGEYYLTLERCGETCCFQGLLGSATAINPSTGAFNLGLVTSGFEEFIGNSLDVTSTLFFNNSSQLGFGGVGYPIPSSHLNAKICNNSEIVINNLGQMIVGDNASNLTANVTFIDGTRLVLEEYGVITVQQGSKLIIEDGAELRINGGYLRVFDGGEVIIKAGGKLIYEDGAQIELNGNNAVLALGGLTHIGDDATFTFTYQGTESGYIRMLIEGHDEERFSAGLNAKVELRGENRDDLILYLEENANFWEFQGAVVDETYSSQKFDWVKFKYGKIVMEEDARIVLLNKSEFIQTTVESLNEGHHPRGVVPFTTCYISHSLFNRVPINASLQDFNSGPLYITSSDFTKSRIVVEGYGYIVQFSDFWLSPIISSAGTVGNKIHYSTFTYESGVSDNSSTDMFIYKSEFINNPIAAAKRKGRLTLKCNTFEQNEIAIYGGEASDINLSSLYSGGYNFFRQNDYNIKLYEAFGLLMEDGYNEFYDANIMNVEGSMDLSCNPEIPVIIAHNNTWSPLTDTGVPFEDPNHPDEAEFDLSVGYWPATQNWVVECQIPFKFGPVAPITACGRYDDPKDPIDPDDTPKSNGSGSEFPLVNSPVYFTDTPFDYAVKVAAFSTTTSDTLNGDDLVAADKFYELLSLAQIDSVSNDSIALVVEHMRWKSLNNYKATIERLFVDSILLRSNNESSFDPIVQNYITVLMEFTDSVKTTANYKEQFQLELWKSSILSTIGKKDKALQILTNINYCDHDSIKRLILLESIQRLEFDLMSSQIDINTFLSDSVTFVLDSTIYEIPLESYIDTTGFGSYIISPNTILFSSCNTASARPSQLGLNASGVNVVLYPNPTQNAVNISFLDGYPSAESVFTLRIFELTGREVFNAKLPPENSRVELPDLANALYLYRLELDDKLIGQGKLSIIE